MNILLADDHAVVRHGLKQILTDAFKRATYGEARNAQEALDLRHHFRADAVAGKQEKFVGRHDPSGVFGRLAP